MSSPVSLYLSAALLILKMLVIQKRGENENKWKFKNQIQLMKTENILSKGYGK